MHTHSPFLAGGESKRGCRLLGRDLEASLSSLSEETPTYCMIACRPGFLKEWIMGKFLGGGCCH